MEVDPILNTIDLQQEKSPLVHVTNLDKRFEKNNDVIIKMEALKKPFYQVSWYHKFLSP